MRLAAFAFVASFIVVNAPAEAHVTISAHVARVTPAFAVPPHIFATTDSAIEQRPSGPSVGQALIEKFTLSGDEIVTPGDFDETKILPLGELHFDAHNDSVYVFSSENFYTGQQVEAYDQNGDARALPGNFGPQGFFQQGVAFDSHDDLFYCAVLESEGFGGPFDYRIEAFDEQGYRHPLPHGSFPNAPFAHSSSTSMFYDPHNGLIYLIVSGLDGTDDLAHVTAWDESGTPQALTGSFGNLGSIQSMTYDAAEGLIFAIGGEPKAKVKHVVAFDESGNEHTVSGFPKNLSEPGEIAYDSSQGVLYIGTTDFQTFAGYGTLTRGTITAWSDGGVQLPLSGRFDAPRSNITDFVLAE